MTAPTENKSWFASMSWWELLKKLFLVMIVLQMVPVFFSSFKGGFTQLMHPKTKVAEIAVRGMLNDSRRIVKQIKKVIDDKDIKAILVRVESGGGAPGTSQLIFSELSRAKSKKPVVVLVENACASGAYYVAMAADCVIAPASAFVGSIGVWSMSLNAKKLAEDWKLSFEVVQSGKFKTVGNPFGNLMTDEERLYRQALSDGTYDAFVHDVARVRGLIVDKKSTWADGKIFTGDQALKLGLIDQVGDLTDAEAELRKRGKFEGEIEYVKAPRPSVWTRLSGSDPDDDPSAEMSSMISTALADAYTKIAMQGSVCQLS